MPRPLRAPQPAVRTYFTLWSAPVRWPYRRLYVVHVHHAHRPSPFPWPGGQRQRWVHLRARRRGPLRPRAGAAAPAAPATVTRHRPPPLATPLTVEADDVGTTRVWHGATVVAEAAPASGGLPLPV